MPAWEGRVSYWSPWPWPNLLKGEQFSLSQRKWREQFTFCDVWLNTFGLELKPLWKPTRETPGLLFHSSNYASDCLLHLLRETIYLLWEFLIATFLPISSVNKYLSAHCVPGVRRGSAGTGMVRQKFLFLWSLLASMGAWVKREINEILAEWEGRRHK